MKEHEIQDLTNVLVNKLVQEQRMSDLLYPMLSMIPEERIKSEPVTGVIGAFDELPSEDKDFEKVLDEVIIDKIKLAERFIQIIPLHFDEAGIWWKFDTANRYWKMIDETDIMCSLEHNTRANVINSREKNEIVNALRLVARKNRPISPETPLLQFNKEVVDIETGNRIKADPMYFITNPLPYKLGMTSETPTFDKLFKEWVGEKEVITLYEILAYCMYPAYPIERIFCLHGSGSYGKSCFIKVLRKFIGMRNVCSTDLQTLTSSRFERVKLFRKLVCEMGETNLHQLENTQLIKRLVSGKDLIGLEMKNKNAFDAVNYAKLIIATNNIPATEDKTEGFYRRWMIVDFPNRFNTEIDVLASIPESEYENLASKCLFILDNLLKRRAFTNDGTIEQRKEKYESKSNPFDKFWTENIEEAYDKDIPVWEFNKRLNDWLKDHRQREMSDMTVSKMMKNRSIQQGRLMKDWYESGSGTKKLFRCWMGITWK